VSAGVGEPLDPKKLILPGLFLALVVGALIWRRPAPVETMAVHGEIMGTTWTVRVVGVEPAELDQIALMAQSELATIDLLMSTWKPESELSRFNDSVEEGAFPLSEQTAEVLALATDVNAGSGGAFDVTVGPAVAAWGFGAGAADEAPTEAELLRLTEVVGFQKLRVDGRTVAKANPGVRIDLSAIAKGYAVDRVSEAMLRAGHGDHMVEVGGEVVARGQKGEGSPWVIAVDKPLYEGREVQARLELRDVALATSGDYRNFIDVDGDKRQHTIDPRTLRPVDHDLASVSVIAPDCASADAWATALMVLGPDKGMAVAERMDIEALFITRGPDRFEESVTSGFGAYRVD